MVDAGLTLRNSIIWAKNNHGTGDLQRDFAPKHERIVYAVKGDPILFNREPDVLEASKVSTDRHPTEKPLDSRTQSSRKASSASASVTLVYSTRPRSFQYECSGPTPG